MVHGFALSSVEYFELLFCVAGLWAITARKQWRDYWALASLLALHTFLMTVFIPLLLAAGHRLNPLVVYPIYFYSYWLDFAAESILSIIVVYCVFRLAMAPLRGLQNLGMLIFRWAAAISIAVALGSAFSVHQTSKEFLMNAIAAMQRTQSILTLCLLLFVCFAIRPMGLSYSSRIFGVSLGLGLVAVNDLVQAARVAITGSSAMTQTGNAVNGVIFCTAAFLWMGYFAMPEPERGLILLPTTSPFLRWNQICEALGDNPGYVAVGGVDSFAPSEIEIMRRASSNVTSITQAISA